MTSTSDAKTRPRARLLGTRATLGLGFGLWISIGPGCSSVLGLDPPGPSHKGGVAGRVEGNEGGRRDVGGGGDGASGAKALGGNLGASGRAGASGGAETGTVAGTAGLGGSVPDLRGGAGGTAGDDTTGQGAETSARGGEGGAHAGAGGASEPAWPREGLPCADAGRLACAFTDPEGTETTNRTLLCRDGVWLSHETCADGQRCDRRTGACAEIVQDCKGVVPESWCDWQKAEMRCGPDLVTLEREPCVFDCLGEACVPAKGNRLIVDRGSKVQSRFPVWPVTNIPVCFTNASETTGALVSDELRRSWGRWSAIGFTGFQECGPDLSGVKVSFVEECTDELGSIDRPGYPGPGGYSSIQICTSYIVDGELRVSDPVMLRFLTRHEFGHVLGFEDGGYSEDSPHFMNQGVDVRSLDTLTVTPTEIRQLQNIYGLKPRGSLATPFGDCVSHDDSGFTSAFCDGSVQQSFRSVAEQVMHVGTGRCISKAAASDEIELLDCSDAALAAAEQTWSFANVEWRGYGGLCVFRRPQALDPEFSGATALGFWPCHVPTPEERNWHFEFAELGKKVRIIHPASAATGTNCVASKRVQNGIIGQVLPAMIACDESAAWLDVTAGGQIALGGNCVSANANWADFAEKIGLLEILPCSRLPEQYFSLSGRVDNPLGFSLTRIDGEEQTSIAAGLTTTATADTQIFDYYF